MKKCSVCKEKKDLGCFYTNKRSNDNYCNRCKKCDKKRSKIRNKNNEEKFRNLIYGYLLKHSCVDCGENRPYVLDFDHTKGVKKFNISESSKIKITENQFWKEIEKCEIRCSNCHRTKTARENNWHSYKKWHVN